MKRLSIIAIAAVLFVSTATIALADDHVDTESSETRELNETQTARAELLAEYFADYIFGVDSETGEPLGEGDPVEEVTNLRTGETVVGWGAMFKLLQLAKATGMSLEELAANEGGWAFGRQFKALTDEQRANLDGAPKNLGQLKKQNREPRGNQGKKP